MPLIFLRRGVACMELVGAGEGERKMGSKMDAKIAKKLVVYVKKHSNITWADVENNIPELKGDNDLKLFASEGVYPGEGFLVKIEGGVVKLGPIAYLVDV